MRLFGRKKSDATEQAKSSVRAFVELNVAPTWWTSIHHRYRGAYTVTINCLVDELDERRLDVLELHATETELTIVVPLDAEFERADYERIAASLQSHLESSVLIEPSDRKRADPEPPPIATTARRVTRAELEVSLKACGFVQSSALDLGEPKPDDKDIWTLPGAASRCVQFDETTQPGDYGKARWMTPTGERALGFDQILTLLEAFGPSGAQSDTQEAALPTDIDQGILPGDGHAHGGIFGKKADGD